MGQSIHFNDLSLLIYRPLRLDVQGSHANAWNSLDFSEWEREGVSKLDVARHLFQKQFQLVQGALVVSKFERFD